MKVICLTIRLHSNECKIKILQNDSSKIDNDIRLIRNKNALCFVCKILHKIINFINGVGLRLHISKIVITFFKNCQLIRNLDVFRIVLISGCRFVFYYIHKNIISCNLCRDEFLKLASSVIEQIKSI